MSKPAGHLPFSRVRRRDDQIEENSRDCGIHAGVGYARLGDDSDQDEDPGAAHVFQDGEFEKLNEGRRCKKDNEVGSREGGESDGEGREQVANDGESKEKGARGWWHAPTEDREDRSDEGDIGHCKDDPSTSRP